jgi:hypothetical protein
LERSDNVADGGHAFAVLKRGYTLRVVLVRKVPLARSLGPTPAIEFANACLPASF